MASATIDKSKGILGDSPNASVAPKFIGVSSIPSIHNRYSAVPDKENIIATLQTFIAESKNIKELLTSLLFSCYQDLIVWLIANVTRHISMPTSDFPTIYHAIITGGYALRYYNQSHLTSDIDVKIFPENVHSTERNEKFLQKNVIDYLQRIIDSQLTDDILMNYLEQYIKRILLPNKSMPKIREILTSINQIKRGGVQFKVKFGEKYADESSEGPIRARVSNKDVVKLLFSFKDVSENEYKLADFAMYDPTDQKYSYLIKGYYDSIHEPVSHIPPFININVNGARVNILSDTFMKFEKTFLTSLPSEITTDRDKARWSKALSSLQQPQHERTYKFLGGKKKRRKTQKMRNRKNKSASKKRTSKRKLLSRHRKKSVKKMRKTRK